MSPWTALTVRERIVADGSDNALMSRGDGRRGMLHVRMFGHTPHPGSLVQVTRPAALPGVCAAFGLPPFPERPYVLASLA